MTRNQAEHIFKIDHRTMAENDLTNIGTVMSPTASMDDCSSTKSNYQRWITKLRGRPCFIWLISVVEVIVFLVELALNWSYTGTPIQIKPSFNPLIGPSTYVLIHIGARFGPCMYPIKDVIDEDLLRFPCPNYTGAVDQDSCSLNELCGFGGKNTPPNQWYRFFLAIFLHGGLVHLVVNIITQLVMGISVEKKIGSWRFALIYVVCGIFGNIVSANLAPAGSASVGCSGSLFGVIALFLLKLLFDWHKTSCSQLIFLIVGIVIDLGLGLLPLIDNFTHIGGFIMGCLLGLILSRSPPKFSLPVPTDRTFATTCQGKLQKFYHTHSRKWWLWCLFRAIILGLTIGLLVISLLNIYLWQVKCTWCQYINCIPIKDWCDTDQLTISDTINSTLTTLSLQP